MSGFFIFAMQIPYIKEVFNAVKVVEIRLFIMSERVKVMKFTLVKILLMKSQTDMRKPKNIMARSRL